MIRFCSVHRVEFSNQSGECPLCQREGRDSTENVGVRAT